MNVEDLVARDCERQGLPEKITDSDALARVAAILQNATAARPATDVRRLRSKEAADVRHQRPLSAA